MKHAIVCSLGGGIGPLVVATMTFVHAAPIANSTGSAQNSSPAAQSARSNRQPAFDIKRFTPTPSDRFETFHVTTTRPLRDALRAGTLQEDTPVLLTETAAGRLALLTDQMTYHHIAQGRAGNKDWMATF